MPANFQLPFQRRIFEGMLQCLVAQFEWIDDRLRVALDDLVDQRIEFMPRRGRWSQDQRARLRHLRDGLVEIGSDLVQAIEEHPAGNLVQTIADRLHRRRIQFDHLQ
jgi:hypothetical protein